MSRTRTISEIDYPDTDFKPMAETDLHRDWMITNIQRLSRFFAGQRVYVSGNLLIYYVEGNPKKSVAPDAFVIKDCPPGRRRTFLIWKEGRVPNFVLETTSKSTRRTDANKKKRLYCDLGVGEYFLFDLLGDWLKPPLQGYRLVGGTYERIAADEDGGLVSEELGVRFVLKNGNLEMFDVANGEPLLSAAERAEALEEELAQLREAAKKAHEPKRKNGK